MPPIPNPRRRLAVAAVLAMPAVWRSAVAASASGPLRPTPQQSEGPFYPVALPPDHDFDLLHNGAARYPLGQAAWVEGTLTDTQGRALSGWEVEIWQCDADGRYHHPADGGRADPHFQGFGRVRVSADGQWRFRTIRPVAYVGRTPHIHVKVRQGTRVPLTTQLYVADDPHNARDLLWRRLDAADRAAITAPYEPTDQGLRARYALVIAT